MTQEKQVITDTNPPYHPLENRHNSIKGGFFTRVGGIGLPPYDTLNGSYSCGDEPDTVLHNRNLVAQVMGCERLVMVHQVHSPTCLCAEDVMNANPVPQADALATDVPGIALAVLTADCTPLLFQGTKENGDPVIGATHAGWRGALSGVIEDTVARMIDYGATIESIQADIGPCIGAQSYEVSTGFESPFLEHSNLAAEFFVAGKDADHLMFDMPSYCAWRLKQLGILAQRTHNHDTVASPELYFSHRRMTLEKRPKEGRQLSAITISVEKD